MRPTVDDRDAVHHLLDFGKQVARHEDPEAVLTREPPHELAHLADTRRVEAVRRFVEDEDGGVGQEGLRDADALAHTE